LPRSSRIGGKFLRELENWLVFVVTLLPQTQVAAVNVTVGDPPDSRDACLRRKAIEKESALPLNPCVFVSIAHWTAIKESFA